jgi:hypothetical protein
MSHNIGAVTVGAVQDLGHHEATRSCWVSLPLILLSRVADQHLWNTFGTAVDLFGGYAFNIALSRRIFDVTPPLSS